MPDPTPDRDKDEPFLMPRKPARPDDGRWCKRCDGEGKHEPGCVMVGLAAELAASLAVCCTVEALSRPKRKD